MKYFDEMRTKFGFGDGGSIPPDAEACRTVYVDALNQVAAKLGCELRAYAYDRPGMHNPFLILFRGKDTQTDHEEREPDEPMNEAIECCRELDLDELVEVQVTVDPGYREKITQMVKEVVND
jgi:hypothetical protein